MTKKASKKPTLTKEEKAMIKEQKKQQKEIQEFQKRAKLFESELIALGKKHKMKMLCASVDKKTGNPFGSQVDVNGMLEMRGMSSIAGEIFS